MQETPGRIAGYIKVREIPNDWTEADYAYWWLPEISDSGRILRMPRISLQERESWTVYEATNILTTAGWTQLLNYIGNASTAVFGKIFSVGTTPISSVSAGDTSVSGELGRVTSGTPTPTGTQVLIPCAFGTNAFPGTWTNVGLYGTSSATTTLGTGTLFTHALFNYTKVNGTAVTVDYLVVLN